MGGSLLGRRRRENKEGGVRRIERGFEIEIKIRQR